MLTDSKTAETKQRVRRLWLTAWASIFFALVVMAATGWTVFSNWTASRTDLARAKSNRVYLRSLTNLLNLLESVESAQRGYLLTGKDHYLDPYRQALVPLDQSLKEFAAAASDRPEEAERVRRLQFLVGVKLNELAKTISLHQEKKHDEASTAVLTDRGLAVMNEIRELSKTILEAQRADVTVRSADSEQHQMRAMELAGTGGLLLVCLMVAGVFALASSAAEQTKLTERLADAKEMFETTLTSIGDGVIATDLTGKVTFINPEAERLTGRSRSAAVGKHLDEVVQLVSESSHDRIESPFHRVMSTGKVVGLDSPTLLVRTDGVETAVDDSGAPIRNVHGEVCGVVMVFRGIEERRQSEAALKASHGELLKANEELRQFSYAATHDLQEPLRTIVIFSQLLSRNYKDALDDRGRHLLQTVEEAGYRMSTLIEDLLAFTRIESTDPAATRIEIDSAAILKDTLVQLNGAIEETKAAVHYVDLPRVWFEPAKLSQLFQNLISNSIKYRKPDLAPVIRISSSLEGEYARFQVSDNGIGFKQEYADRIFLLFQRLHGRSIPGTGIGLALCRRIVERQGGKIWAQSAENEGSSFFFTLPLAK